MKQGLTAIGLWVVVAILVLVASLGGWALKVALSDVKGQGNAVITKNSSGNRIAAQEAFEARFADIQATDLKLDVLADAAESGDRTAEQNLTGTQNYCLSVVADYNAAARSYTSADFRAIDLPAQIDLTDPSTDCQPNN